MAWWTPAWRKEAEDWTFLQLPTNPDAAGGPLPQAEAETDYLSVFLKSARLVDRRRGFTTFYGAVHSYISLPHRSGGNAEFNVVTTPSALKNVDAAGLDRVIQINQRLLGPVAYAGGDLDIEAGLFAVASSNLAAPYLQLLESLSKTAGVAYVSAALPFAAPILEGMRLLTQSDKDVALEIGYSTTQPAPKLGYVAVIRAPRGTVDARKLRVDGDDFRLLLDGAALREYPYMILEFTAEPTRSDWFSIPEIAVAYRKVQEEFRAGQEQGLSDALVVFRRTALTCNDLQYDDARRLAQKVEERYRAIGPPKPQVRGAARAPVALPDLREMDLYDRGTQSLGT
jgi:hypothetical protein